MRIEYNVATTVARVLDAKKRCEKEGNEWAEKHAETLEWLNKQFFPSGSGIDSGTELWEPNCTADKLVLFCSYHHMNDNGMYDGWTEHKIIITPDWGGINVKVTGRDRNNIKDYLIGVFECAFTQVCHIIDPANEMNEYGWYWDGVWHKRKEK